ncbi:DUF5708 family protein [Streptomyces sp. NPDC058953]|uniref:DUF5708 family protein n=1 Tax=unclassified Streptomyces TaxID=2593676 RepID=UPI0036B2CCB7
MRPARRNLTDGTVTALAGLALMLFTDGVEVPVVTLTKVGVVMMAIGAAGVLVGLVQSRKSEQT